MGIGRTRIRIHQENRNHNQSERIGDWKNQGKAWKETESGNREIWEWDRKPQKRCHSEELFAHWN